VGEAVEAGLVPEAKARRWLEALEGGRRLQDACSFISVNRTTGRAPERLNPSCAYRDVLTGMIIPVGKSLSSFWFKILQFGAGSPRLVRLPLYVNLS